MKLIGHLTISISHGHSIFTFCKLMANNMSTLKVKDSWGCNNLLGLIKKSVLKPTTIHKVVLLEMDFEYE